MYFENVFEYFTKTIFEYKSRYFRKVSKNTLKYIIFFLCVFYILWEDSAIKIDIIRVHRPIKP